MLVDLGLYGRPRRSSRGGTDWFSTNGVVRAVSRDEVALLEERGFGRVSVGSVVQINGMSELVHAHPSSSFEMNVDYRSNAERESRWGRSIWATSVARHANSEQELADIIREDAHPAVPIPDVDGLAHAIWDAFGDQYGTNLVAATCGVPGVRLREKVDRILEASGIDMACLYVVCDAVTVPDDTSAIRRSLPSLSVACANRLSEAIETKTRSVDPHISAVEAWRSWFDRAPYEALDAVWWDLRKNVVRSIDHAVLSDVEGAMPDDERRVGMLVDMAVGRYLANSDEVAVRVHELLAEDGVWATQACQLVSTPDVVCRGEVKPSYAFTALDFFNYVTSHMVRCSFDADMAELPANAHIVYQALGGDAMDDLLWRRDDFEDALAVSVYAQDADLPYVSDFDDFDGEVDALVHEYEQRVGIALDDSQREAVHRCARKRVSIICGGPGCGKTTVVDAVGFVRENLLERLHRRRTLTQACAISGKACSVLRERKGALSLGRVKEEQVRDRAFRSVLTVASIEHVSGFYEKTATGVIDEASMAPTGEMRVVMDKLFGSGLDENASFIVVGDESQLPPVGFGRAFVDMLDSGAVPTSRLSVQHRVEGGVGLVDAFAALRRGDSSVLRHAEGVKMVDLGRMSSLSQDATRYILRRYLMHTDGGKNPRDALLITPRNAEVDLLNDLLQSRLNPRGEVVAVDGDGREFRVGDRILCRRNDNKADIYYEKDGARVRSGGRPLVNGDVGTIMNVSRSMSPGGKERVACCVELDSVADDEGNHYRLELGADDLLASGGYDSEEDADEGVVVRRRSNTRRNWQHGWATTVHSAQGSEAPSVVFVMPYVPSARFSSFWSLPLVYTAATRAKRDLDLIVSVETFEQAVSSKASPETSIASLISGMSDAAESIRSAWLEAGLRVDNRLVLSSVDGAPVPDDGVPVSEDNVRSLDDVRSPDDDASVSDDVPVSDDGVSASDDVRSPDSLAFEDVRSMVMREMARNSASVSEDDVRSLADDAPASDDVPMSDGVSASDDVRSPDDGVSASDDVRSPDSLTFEDVRSMVMRVIARNSTSVSEDDVRLLADMRSPDDDAPASDGVSVSDGVSKSESYPLPWDDLVPASPAPRRSDTSVLTVEAEPRSLSRDEFEQIVSAFERVGVSFRDDGSVRDFGSAFDTDAKSRETLSSGGFDPVRATGDAERGVSSLNDSESEEAPLYLSDGDELVDESPMGERRAYVCIPRVENTSSCSYDGIDF
jgi:hypothetical protein